MTCLICKEGQLIQGTTTITLERDGMTLVIRQVPAKICKNCGEAYVEDTVTAELLQMAEQALKTGVQVDVRNYVAA